MLCLLPGPVIHDFLNDRGKVVAGVVLAINPREECLETSARRFAGFRFTNAFCSLKNF
jgi:hypothetical protein